MARKITKKLSKEQKSLLIGLLLGDGTISSNYVFKLSHSEAQREFLQWKVDLLNKFNIKNNGIKEYISKCGYNIGKNVLYSQMSLNPTIKALRRTIYIPKKTITRRLLNWLNPLGIAIWYMDDGCINVNTSKQRSSIQHTIKIATCVDEPTINIIIQYFLEVWNIKFRPFKEGKGTFSIASSTEEDCKKFIEIVKPYIEQVPSLLYKIRDNFTKEEFIAQQKAVLEAQDTVNED
jgi:recombination protein RecA